MIEEIIKNYTYYNLFEIKSNSINKLLIYFYRT